VELVAILRVLLRRPILTAIGAVAAIAAGVLAGSGETTKTGTASARLVVDTAKSQLIHQAPTGADTLLWRTVMLADLTASRPLMDRIASEVGVRRNQVVVVQPELAVPVIPATLPSRAAAVAGVIPEEYVLTVRFDELLPIISLEAEAPDRRAAARLVEAAGDALKDTGTPVRMTPRIQGLAVESVGPVRSKTIIDRPQPLLGVGIAIVVFTVWSAGVALIPRVRSAWRYTFRRPRPV
jgi:hypothetical protein